MWPVTLCRGHCNWFSQRLDLTCTEKLEVSSADFCFPTSNYFLCGLRILRHNVLLWVMVLAASWYHLRSFSRTKHDVLHFAPGAPRCSQAGKQSSLTLKSSTVKICKVFLTSIAEWKITSTLLWNFVFMLVAGKGRLQRFAEYISQASMHFGCCILAIAGTFWAQSAVLRLRHAWAEKLLGSWDGLWFMRHVRTYTSHSNIQKIQKLPLHTSTPLRFMQDSWAIGSYRTMLDVQVAFVKKIYSDGSLAVLPCLAANMMKLS